MAAMPEALQTIKVLPLSQSEFQAPLRRLLIPHSPSITAGPDVHGLRQSPPELSIPGVWTWPLLRADWQGSYRQSEECRGTPPTAPKEAAVSGSEPVLRGAGHSLESFHYPWDIHVRVLP